MAQSTDRYLRGLAAPVGLRATCLLGLVARCAAVWAFWQKVGCSAKQGFVSALISATLIERPDIFKRCKGIPKMSHYASARSPHVSMDRKGR
jgi:hypothetical protein